MINKDEEILIYSKAINTFGQAIQKVIAMEESSELIQAIVDKLNQCENNVEEEIADFEIMYGQLSIMYDGFLIDEYNKDPIKPTYSSSRVVVKALSKLIQELSKSIRYEDYSIEEYISNAYRYVKLYKLGFDVDEIEKIKQQKLNRLKGIVW